MNLLIETIIWLVIIQGFVAVHYIVIEVWKKNPNHPLSFVIAAALGIVLSCIIYDTLYFRVVSVIYLGLMFWILFPLELNIARKKPPLYLGDPKNKKGSFLDRFERSLKNPGATLGLKIVIMIMCAFILIDIPNKWEW